MSESIVIVAAARTPMGSFQGDFASLAAHDLGGAAIAAAVQRAGVAPEQVDEKRAYDQQVDMWSLGVLLYIMLSGRHPFERAHTQHGDQARSGRQEQMLQDILHANYAFDPAQWTGASRAGDRRG